jgi:hypothetical protein
LLNICSYYVCVSQNKNFNSYYGNHFIAILPLNIQKGQQCILCNPYQRKTSVYSQPLLRHNFILFLRFYRNLFYAISSKKHGTTYETQFHYLRSNTSVPTSNSFLRFLQKKNAKHVCILIHPLIQQPLLYFNHFIFWPINSLALDHYSKLQFQKKI